MLKIGCLTKGRNDKRTNSKRSKNRNVEWTKGRMEQRSNSKRSKNKRSNRIKVEGKQKVEWADLQKKNRASQNICEFIHSLQNLCVFLHEQFFLNKKYNFFNKGFYNIYRNNLILTLVIFLWVFFQFIET